MSGRLALKVRAGGSHAPAYTLAGDVTATIKDAGIASADVDGDGQVTSNDITLMLKKIARKISDFHAEERPTNKLNQQQGH